MLGKTVKNLQHLLRDVGENSTRKVIIISENYPDIGEAIRVNNKILIFNHCHANTRFNSEKYISSPNFSILKSLQSRYSGIISFEEETKRWISDKIQQIILLSDEFDTSFDMFIKNNNKQYNQLVSKYGVSRDISGFMNYLYYICNNSINFFSWGIKNHIQYSVRSSLIHYVLTWNDKYSQFANKLKKGTITAYNGKTEVLKLTNELANIRFEKRVSDSINLFNTAQKKILKENVPSDNKAKEVLNIFGRLSDVKKRNFVRKMSTIEDYCEIMKQLSNLCEVHFSWNKDSFIEYITNVPNINCKVVFDYNNVIVICVNDYETIKKLAKTTNWCISKNKRYWNDYVEYNRDANQYIVFDFNKEEDSEYSIVGFTNVRNKGITHAHSFTNMNLMKRGDYVDNIRTFERKCNNIFSLLKCNGIPLELFSKTLHSPFGWNKVEMFEFINKQIGEDDYDVLHNEGDKVAIVSKNESFVKLFNKECFRHFDYSYFTSREFFIFFDFEKTEIDDERILVAFISDRGDEECAVSNCYSASLMQTTTSFDEVLMNFDLPYDIIKRIDNPINRFLSSFSSYNFRIIDFFLKNKEVVDYIIENKTLNNYSFIINDSFFSLKTNEMIKLLYDNRIKLSDILSEDCVNELITNLVGEIANFINGSDKLPTEKDVEDVYTEVNIPTDKRYFIGYFGILDMICKNENISCILAKLMIDYSNLRAKKFMMEYLSNYILNNFDWSENNVSIHKTLLMTLVKIFEMQNKKDMTTFVLSKLVNENHIKEFNSLVSTISYK